MVDIPEVEAGGTQVTMTGTPAEETGTLAVETGTLEVEAVELAETVSADSTVSVGNTARATVDIVCCNSAAHDGEEEVKREATTR